MNFSIRVGHFGSAQHGLVVFPLPSQKRGNAQGHGRAQNRNSSFFIMLSCALLPAHIAAINKKSKWKNSFTTKLTCVSLCEKSGKNPVGPNWQKNYYNAVHSEGSSINWFMRIKMKTKDWSLHFLIVCLRPLLLLL